MKIANTPKEDGWPVTRVTFDFDVNSYLEIARYHNPVKPRTYWCYRGAGKWQQYTESTDWFHTKLAIIEKYNDAKNTLTILKEVV